MRLLLAGFLSFTLTLSTLPVSAANLNIATFRSSPCRAEGIAGGGCPSIACVPCRSSGVRGKPMLAGEEALYGFLTGTRAKRCGTTGQSQT